MRTAHRSRGDKDGVQYYAAELQIDGRTFGRVMITSPVDVAKIDAHWWDFKSYATAHHIVAHVQGRQLIEGRCNELSVGGGWVRGADPNGVKAIVGDGEIVMAPQAPAPPAQAVVVTDGVPEMAILVDPPAKAPSSGDLPRDPDATLEPAS